MNKIFLSLSNKQGVGSASQEIKCFEEPSEGIQEHYKALTFGPKKVTFKALDSANSWMWTNPSALV